MNALQDKVNWMRELRKHTSLEDENEVRASVCAETLLVTACCCRSLTRSRRSSKRAKRRKRTGKSERPPTFHWLVIERGARAVLRANRKRMEDMQTLGGLLRNPLGLDHFMQFVVDNHCEENLLFWIEAEDYRTSGSCDRRC